MAVILLFTCLLSVIEIKKGDFFVSFYARTRNLLDKPAILLLLNFVVLVGLLP